MTAEEAVVSTTSSNRKGTVRRTCCADDSSEAGFGNTEEGVRVGGGKHGVDGNAERAVGAVLEACRV